MGRARPRVVGDDVDFGFDSLEQTRESVRILESIVVASEKHILEGDAPSARQGQPARGFDHFPNGILAVDRHELVAALVRGRMKAYGQTNRGRLCRERLELIDDSRRRHRNPAGRHRECVVIGEHLERGQDSLGIEKRLPHPHEHDVRSRGRHRQIPAREHELGEDLPGLEVALETDRARKTKRAFEGTAHLSRQTKRVPLAIGDVDGLDVAAVRELEEVFDRAVSRDVPLGNRGQRDREDPRKIRPKTS